MLKIILKLCHEQRNLKCLAAVSKSSIENLVYQEEKLDETISVSFW